MLSAYVFVSMVTVFFVLTWYLTPSRANTEPPILHSKVPLVGHVIGMLRHGTIYYQKLRETCSLPIFTLNAINIKIYVVNSMDLVNAVDRNSKTLAFNPFVAGLGKRMTGHDEATGQIIQHNLNGENGPGYVTEIHDGTIAALASGPNLEQMTKTMLLEMQPYFRCLRRDGTVDLFAWLKESLTLCSTRAIYGPENPFNRDTKTCVKAFWDFDHQLNLLLSGLLPEVLARKAYAGRKRLSEAFKEYYDSFDPSHNEVSGYARMRASTNNKHGLTTANQGCIEVGIIIGILVNTTPTIFYMLMHVISDPALLASIRHELDTIAVRRDHVHKLKLHVFYLEVNTMREKCPLLAATFQETLRHHAKGASARYVREDTMLGGQYLLKKGNIVQVPIAVLHADASVWGPDVKEFRPQRFLAAKAGAAGGEKRDPARYMGRGSTTTTAGYRPFGGGTSLCPGRHFVTLEAMALVAMFVLQFDFEPAGPTGEWQIPSQLQESVATNVFPPATDVKIKVTERKWFEGVEWRIDMR